MGASGIFSAIASSTPLVTGVNAKTLPGKGVSFTVGLESPGVFSLRLYDIKGRVCWKYNAKEALADYHTITLGERDVYAGR